jgi:hypothetical protein
MGYYTRYSLELEQLEVVDQKAKSIKELIAQISNSNEVDRTQLIKDLQDIENPPITSAEEIIAKLRETNENAKYSLGEDGEAQDESKWYDHEPEFKEFSKQFPSWLFTLTGEGEESGNLWKKYFLNGKVQIANAIISYDNFDMK